LSHPPHTSPLFPYTTLFRSVVLEKLGGQRLVHSVFLSQLQGDAHQIQAIHSHPTGGVGLLEHATVGALDTAIHDADVVQAQKTRSEEHTSELQSLRHLVCRL